MSGFVLITGGARSGKSRFAEILSASYKLPVTYIATAQILDDEMASRVEKHRLQRPQNWKLIEEPYAIPEILQSLKEENGVILLDCVTLWLSNLLLSSLEESGESGPSLSKPPGFSEKAEQEILSLVREAANIAREITPQVIMVTNEVGLGIVPDNALARAYRDLVGRANQILSQAADKVYLVVAGYPIEIKQPGLQILHSLGL